MRRAPFVIAATVIGLWLILSFKSSPLPRTEAASTPAPSSSLPPTAPPNSSAPAAGPPPPRDSTPPTTATPAGRRTLDGVVVSTRYGDVQVEAILNGNRIVDVKPLQLPFDRPRSQDISDQAAPLLREEVLQAQSAQIDTIGGATYTSEAYAQSLQSALDKAAGG